MSGLLGSMIAGGVKQVSQGRLDQLDRQDQFNMQNALLKAREDMDPRLKEAGINMQEAAAGRERDRVKGFFQPGEDDSPVSISQAAENAARSGDVDTAKGLINSQPATNKSFDSIKLDDGSVMSFDKSTGKGEIILPGGKKVDVPKSEIELAYQAAGNDPKKALEILVSQKKQVASAGRAPAQPTQFQMSRDDFIHANRDNPELVQNGRLTNKGLQEFNQLGKAEPLNETRTEVRDENGGKVTTIQRGINRPTQSFDANVFLQGFGL